MRETDDITIEYDQFTTKSEANANAATGEIDDTTLTSNSDDPTLTWKTDDATLTCETDSDDTT